MKKLNYKIIIPCSLILMIVIVACGKNYLNKPTLGTLDPSIVANSDGVNGLLIGAYSLLDGEGAPGDGTGAGASNWIYGGISSDDAYKGSDNSDFNDALAPEIWTTTSTLGILGQKWTVVWVGVQRANEVLRIMPLAKDISAANVKTITAETRFLRGFYHLEAKKIWNNIPFLDETVVVGTTTPIDNTIDAWPKIEADLQFAVDNLPATQPQPGRVNSWAAKAFLAKAYMFEHKYAQAKTLLNDIIANGTTPGGTKYALLPHYASNFNAAQKNSSESVFAAQMSVQDGSSTNWGSNPNGNFGDILNFPYNGGPGGCCGFYNPSQDLANAYKTDAAGLPLLDTWFNGASVSRPTGAYVGNLDPRIDITIGRPGIPYLDWGPHPGDAWIRNVGADGHFSPKKNVFAASQKNQYTDAGSAYWAPTELTSNNVNLIRYADVLLWAAECELQPGGDPEKARGYVNQIRARAADPTGWVYKNSDFDAPTYTYKTQTTPADTYKIGQYPAGSFAADLVFAAKAVVFERRLELAMEGHRFFDLVRWGVADVVLNAYSAREAAFVSYKTGAHFTKGKNEYYPIPLDELTLLNSNKQNKMVQNPGYN